MTGYILQKKENEQQAKQLKAREVKHSQVCKNQIKSVDMVLPKQVEKAIIMPDSLHNINQKMAELIERAASNYHRSEESLTRN